MFFFLKVKSLVNELKINAIQTISKDIEKTKDIPIKRRFDGIKNGLNQIKPMFKKPYLPYCLLAFSIEFTTLFG